VNRSGGIHGTTLSETQRSSRQISALKKWRSSGVHRTPSSGRDAEEEVGGWPAQGCRAGVNGTTCGSCNQDTCTPQSSTPAHRKLIDTWAVTNPCLAARTRCSYTHLL